MDSERESDVRKPMRQKVFHNMFFIDCCATHEKVATRQKGTFRDAISFWIFFLPVSHNFLIFLLQLLRWLSCAWQSRKNTQRQVKNLSFPSGELDQEQIPFVSLPFRLQFSKSVKLPFFHRIPYFTPSISFLSRTPTPENHSSPRTFLEQLAG